MKKTLATKQAVFVFSQETVDSLNQLGNVYAKIRARLLSEGYMIKDGKIIPPKIKIQK